MGRPRKYGLSARTIKDQRWAKINAYVLDRANQVGRNDYRAYREGIISFADMREAVQELLKQGMAQADAEMAELLAGMPTRPSSQQTYYQKHREEILDRLWRQRHPNPTDDDLKRRIDGLSAKKRYVTTTKGGKEALKRAESKYAHSEKGRAARSRANSKYRAKVAALRAIAKSEYNETPMP